MNTAHTTPPTASARWERAGVTAAVLLSLALSSTRLDGPCLWHDELVHVFVAKHVAAHGWPALPSGAFYPSSLAYNLPLGLVSRLFGDGPVAMRFPSALLGALNVFLAWRLMRSLAGREAALVTAFALALSPWHVAWAREARMYQLQVTAYLVTLHAAWRAFESPNSTSALRPALWAVAGFVLGMLTSYHSLLFLGTVGGYAGLMLLNERRLRSRWTTALILCAALGCISLTLLLYNPNPADRGAVFQTGLGGTLVDPQRNDRLFYFHWLRNNLSTGFFALALAGTALLPWRERKAGLFAALAFWVPALVLTFLIGYRRERFLFFAFPFYVLLFSYALTAAVAWLKHGRQSWRHALAAALLLLFLARLSVTEFRLLQDTARAARGDALTLAKLHPEWRKPGNYVRQHRTTETLLTTTCLGAMYYAGDPTDWFPCQFQWWEGPESGKQGLKTLEELKAFVAQHPRGYYIAEYERFEKWAWAKDLPELGRAADWIHANMTRIDEACSADVFLYRWGF